MIASAQPTQTAGELLVVPIASIRRDPGLQIRERGVDPDVVADYAAAILAGAQLPPVVLYEQPGPGSKVLYWLADGSHRVAAALQAGEGTVLAEVRPGGFREALEHACGANADHGFRRTAADKRRAVRLWLDDPERRALSDRAIAERCRVHHDLVGTVRAELGHTDTVRTGRDGRPIQTARIGDANRARHEPEPAPVTPALPDPEPREHDAATDAGDAQVQPPAHYDHEEIPSAAPRAEQPVEVQVARIREELAALPPEHLTGALSGLRPADVRRAVKTERKPYDAYYTPDHVARACVGWLLEEGYLPRRSGLRILEGHVGGWAWVRALVVEPRLSRPQIHALDLDPEAVSRPGTDWPAVVSRGCGDFAEHDAEQPYDAVIGNPPYGELIAPHLRAAVAPFGAAPLVRTGGIVAWLLRRDWLGAARAGLVAEGLAPVAEAVIAPRVSFVGTEGTDLHEHSLFVWRCGLERVRPGRRTWRTTLIEARP